MAVYTVKQRNGNVVATGITEEQKDRLQGLASYRNLKFVAQVEPAKPAEKLPKGVKKASPSKGTKPRTDNGGTTEDAPADVARSGRAKTKTSE